MSITTYLYVFASGLIVGMSILFVAQKVSAGEEFNFVFEIGRLFSRLRGSLHHQPHSDTLPDEPPVAPTAAVDPREQNLYDSAQTIREILQILATSIQRTNKAANDSSQVLGDVKSAMNTMQLPTDVNKAHAMLSKEIERVLASNAALKGELAQSQQVLTDQQHQIKNLRTAVRIDSLTQVGNRAYFDEKLHEMIALRKRYEDPFSLMMIDLDNFKAINDTYGHPAGDRILKGVALQLKAALRGSDFLARFGGDEYALLLMKTDIKAATEVAWKLCEQVRASRFVLDKTALSLTLSIGVAEATKNDTDETILQRADAALYRTKMGGRNGVSAAEASR
ncbi:MAG TPA: GGDEF domain-containing protein [Desulfuromonadales bacterium]|nr:GGDEF domain-containing protein [Desulfuromonadales bacterium]